MMELTMGYDFINDHSALMIDLGGTRISYHMKMGDGAFGQKRLSYEEFKTLLNMMQSAENEHEKVLDANPSL